MAKHLLETKYGLTAGELLDAVNARFRLKVAVEGAVAEFHMSKHLERLVGSTVSRYEQHDSDGRPDFSDLDSWPIQSSPSGMQKRS